MFVKQKTKWNNGSQRAAVTVKHQQKKPDLWSEVAMIQVS